MQRRFAQLDVFSDTAGLGNPLAVVIDADGLSDDEMQRFANWTNLSETTFLLPPTDPNADYRVRIFTPTTELPFAGHPTLGSCWAWLEAGGTPKGPTIAQECGIGLVSVRTSAHPASTPLVSFAAPQLLRSGPVDAALASLITEILGREPAMVAWGDNGPGWVIAQLASGDDVVGLQPRFPPDCDIDLGVFGWYPPGTHGPNMPTMEVRAFFPGPNVMLEDPVTGSLNASIAVVVTEADPHLREYTARQGTALGRAGNVNVARDSDDTIWVGGAVTGVVSGVVDI